MSAHRDRHSRHPELSRLKDLRLLRELAYVDGKWTAGRNGEVIDVHDPCSNRIIAWVARLDADAVTDAVTAGQRAYPAWSSLLPQDRAARLQRWHEQMLAAKEDLALIMTLEQGKPIAEARGEIDYAASFIEWYAGEAKRLNVESVASHLPGAEMLVQRSPLGVVGV